MHFERPCLTLFMNKRHSQVFCLPQHLKSKQLYARCFREVIAMKLKCIFHCEYNRIPQGSGKNLVHGGWLLQVLGLPRFVCSLPEQCWLWGASYGTTVENGTHNFPPQAFRTKHKAIMWPLKAKTEKPFLGPFLTPYTLKKVVYINPYKSSISFLRIFV